MTLAILSFIFCLFNGHKDSTVIAPKQKSIQIHFPESNFTNPGLIYNGGQPSFDIRNRLVQLIDAVPQGDSMFMSMYLINDGNVIDALKDADKRGVQVHILVDSSRSESMDQNQDAYQALAKLPNYMAVLNDNHASINHNKFAVFSAIQTKDSVAHAIVFQTSNNMTRRQCTYFQDNVILQDEGLYDAYRQNWYRIAQYAKGGMVNIPFTEYDNQRNATHAYFFPKLKDGNYFGQDPVVEILDSITHPQTATIRILMLSWTGGRLDIVKKLQQLLTQGAKVEIIVSSDNDKVENMLQPLIAGGASVRLFEIQKGIAKAPHSKYLLIEGEWKNERATILATGSENYTGPALKSNNETLLRLKNSPLYPSYLDNFNRIKNL